MKPGNTTSVTLAVAVEAAARIFVYALETLTAHDIPTEIEGAMSLLTLGVVLYLVPSKDQK